MVVDVDRQLQAFPMIVESGEDRSFRSLSQLNSGIVACRNAFCVVAGTRLWPSLCEDGDDSEDVDVDVYHSFGSCRYAEQNASA